MLRSNLGLRNNGPTFVRIISDKTVVYGEDYIKLA